MEAVAASWSIEQPLSLPANSHTATQDTGLDFDWLDKLTMDRVGYKRINKTTGKDITSDNIVKGIEYEDGQYVILSQEEIEAAYLKITQTVEIEAFVGAGEIPFVYLEKPYYVAPINRGSKVYALLLENLKASHCVGIAKVLITRKQHLAVLIPCGQALILNLLSWGDEIRLCGQLPLPEADGAGLKPAEMAMAKQLVEEMTTQWDPRAFRDEFREQVMAVVEQKAQAGQARAVQEVEGSPCAPSGADIVDLTSCCPAASKA